jgi:hypothetical protein
MALVTREELKLTLGVGDLYANEVLDQVIDSAESTILALLTRDRVHIDQVCCTEALTPPATGTTIRFRTVKPHNYTVGLAIRFGEFPRAGFAGKLLTVTDVPEDDIVVAQAETPFNPGEFDPTPVIPNGVVYREVAIDFYDDIPEVREATLAIAVDIFQSRVAPGGQIEAVDFTPGPYRLGRSLFSRVQGLLARWVDTGSLVG